MNAPVTIHRQADHPVAPSFVERWSPRAFDATPMTEAEVMLLLEAARWAPSAMNLQPWRFVVALRGEPGFDAIHASLSGNNRLWAGRAAALVVFVSQSKIPQPDGTERESGSHAFDTGAAWGAFGVQAHLAGWHSHAMGGFDREALHRAINLPEGFVVQAVVAVGRRGNPETLPEALRQREVPSLRRPLSESVLRGGFPAP
jgi:nitroreductase